MFKKMSMPVKHPPNHGHAHAYMVTEIDGMSHMVQWKSNSVWRNCHVCSEYGIERYPRKVESGSCF
jgi:hypothetical protein